MIASEATAMTTGSGAAIGMELVTAVHERDEQTVVQERDEQKRERSREGKQKDETQRPRLLVTGWPVQSTYGWGDTAVNVVGASLL
jgi:NAD dependent epimerase/dehydratase family enzyme